VLCNPKTVCTFAARKTAVIIGKISKPNGKSIGSKER
jgi:hypothetical protein